MIFCIFISKDAHDGLSINTDQLWYTQVNTYFYQFIAIHHIFEPYNLRTTTEYLQN